MVDRSNLLGARWVFLALLTVAAVSCTAVDEPEAAPEETRTSTSVAMTSTTTALTTTTDSPTTTVAITAPIPTTTQPAATTTTLPGAPYDGPGPQAGDLLSVVGVAHDDVLNIREGPGLRYNNNIIGELEPTASGISITGEARLLPTAIWYEITIGGRTGWVSGAFIGLFGFTDAATNEAYAMLGNPVGDDDLAALGATIADAFLSDEGFGRIALVEPSEGGSPTAVSSITYDVIGLSDDAIKGYRLVIHATQAVDDGPYTLHSVERTYICWRGVDADDLCV